MRGCSAAGSRSYVDSLFLLLVTGQCQSKPGTAHASLAAFTTARYPDGDGDAVQPGYAVMQQPGQVVGYEV